MIELSSQVIEEVYGAVRNGFLKAARAQGRGVEDADEVCHEAIARMLEAHQKTPIDNPLHWVRHTAANLWKDLRRREKKHLSYDGVEGLSLTEGTHRPHVEGDVEDRTLRLRETGASHKKAMGMPVRWQMVEAVTEWRGPEVLAEQRDFIQKIDPDWLVHMEEGYDFRTGKKLDRNTRRKIQRRAEALLREEPLC